MFTELTWSNGTLAAAQFESVTDLGGVTTGIHLVYDARTGDLLYGAGSEAVLLASFGTNTHPALSAADFMMG